MALLVAACTGGSDSGLPERSDDTEDTRVDDVDEVDDADDSVPDAEDGTTTDPQAPASTDEADAAAADWLSGDSGLDATVVAQLQPERTVPSGPVTHVTFAQFIDGRRVLSSEITVHVMDDGTVQGASEALTMATPSGAAVTTDEAAASLTASKAVDGTVEGEPTVEPIWSQVGDALTPAWLVSVSTRNPIGSWQIVVDASNGVVIATNRAGRTAHGRSGAVPSKIGGSLPVVAAAQTDDACTLPAAPSACVFLNPFAAAGGPVDPGDANDYLTGVSLEGLGTTEQLSGQYVDVAFPGSPLVPDSEADGTWAGGVGSRNFEAAMSYYWLDRTQRLMQRLGFSIRADQPTEVVPVFPEEVDNAFFDAIDNRIFMGVGSDGINAAQDATVLVHEYGHAVLDAQVGTDTHFSSEELAAYSEGFGDLLAGLSLIEFRAGDPACISGWFGLRNDCFRRLDTDRVFPQDLTREVHDDGELFAGAVWDIFEGLLAKDGLTTADCFGTDACAPATDRLLSVILSSHFYLVNGADFFDISSAYLQANEAGFADADRAIFEAGFAAHGLLGDSGTSMDPTGQTTETPSGSVSVSVDIAHDYRGDLAVSVGVVDASYEPLCDEIVLAEADPEDGEDNLFGVIDVSDSPCAQFVPPSPDQLWYLYVVDELDADEGEILEFQVLVGDDPYPAGGLPLVIPDGDPDGVFALASGDGSVVQEEDQAAPGPPVDGQPFFTLDITHTYNGDLSVRGGVVDIDGDIICSVPIQNPDPSDGSGGVAGSVDMGQCASFYPPTADQPWFLQVIDTAVEDVGTVDQFSLTGPDGAVFEFADVPAEIPDDDVDGVALLLTDSGGSNGTAGGSGQTSSVELPAVSVGVTHTFAGDLAVTAGVADADLNVLCEVVVRTADPQDSSADLATDVSLSECAQFYPPTPDQQWYLFVRDTLADDVGTVTKFTLTGPDGQVFDSPDVGTDIPDADQDGLALFLSGAESMSAGGGGATVSYVIDHSYAGDLYVEVGVVDAAGTFLCGLVVREPDPDDDSVDLSGQADLSECAAFYPPSPDQVWYISATDSADFDEGTISAFVIGGPDGVVRDAGDLLPVIIPDNDPVGVSVSFDS
ncbi:MAG: M36 family metallopeptidase [Ilumatobacter sp.]